MNQTSQEQSPSGISIAALVTGILFMGIVPIILGAVDLSRIKKGQSSEKGRGFDVAGIEPGAISILFWIIMSIVWAVALSAAFLY